MQRVEVDGIVLERHNRSPGFDHITVMMDDHVVMTIDVPTAESLRRALQKLVPRGRSVIT